MSRRLREGERSEIAAATEDFALRAVGEDEEFMRSREFRCSL
jgi:hypothetical protein